MISTRQLLYHRSGRNPSFQPRRFTHALMYRLHSYYEYEPPGTYTYLVVNAYGHCHKFPFIVFFVCLPSSLCVLLVGGGRLVLVTSSRTLQPLSIFLLCTRSNPMWRARSSLFRSSVHIYPDAVHIQLKKTYFANLRHFYNHGLHSISFPVTQKLTESDRAIHQTTTQSHYPHQNSKTSLLQ